MNQFRFKLILLEIKISRNKASKAVASSNHMFSPRLKYSVSDISLVLVSHIKPPCLLQYDTVVLKQFDSNK